MSASARSLARLASLALVLAACGRVGYERGAPDGSTEDATVPVCEASVVADYCAEVPALPAAPVIDGAVDCALPLRAIDPQGWYSVDASPIPAGVAARYAVAWRPDGLYFYVEVDDPAVFPSVATSGMLWCADSAEIYVDSDGVVAAPPAYDDPGARQLIARAPTGDTPETLGDRYLTTTLLGPWDGGFVSVTRPGGYALEAFVDAADLGLGAWTLAEGANVGVDVGVNVSTADGAASTDCGSRLGQYFLRVASSGTDGCNLRPYCNASAFCTPVLVP